MIQAEYVENSYLKELHSSNFEMATGEPDIRNWKVVGLNKEVGRVSELLFDEISHRVRYLILDINGKPLNLISRTVLVPIGLADLLKEEKIVLLPGLTISRLASLPTYEKGRITRDAEIEVRNIFSATDPVAYRNEEINDVDGYYDRDAFYNHEHFNDRRTDNYRTDVISKHAELKEDIRENLERVKDTVKKMEKDVDRLGKPSL